MKHHRTFVAVVMYVLALTSGLLAQRQTEPAGPVGGPNLAAKGNTVERSLPTPVTFHRGLKAGDVIARGNRVDSNRNGIAESDECEFDFGVKIALVSGSRTVTIGRGPDCTAVLQDVQDVDVVEAGDVEQEPVAAVRAPGGVLAAARGLVGRVWDAVFPTVTAQPLYSRKVAYGHVYTWGGGGPVLDGLTAQQGWLTWDYNLQVAELRHIGTWGYFCAAGPSPGCQPPLTIPPMFPTNLGWISPMQSFQDVYAGPGAVVTRLDWSSWEFIGGTFKHTLYERRNGRYNGVGECIGWITGSYPVSWTTHCDVHFP